MAVFIEEANFPYPESYQFSLNLPISILKIHFNIILPSIPSSSQWSLSFRSSQQNPINTDENERDCEEANGNMFICNWLVKIYL